MATRPDSSAHKFDEGRAYLVRRLHMLDVQDVRQTVQDAAVVFTPGWVFVQEAGSDGYVVPRERVLLVEGVRRPHSAEAIGIPSADPPTRC